MVLGPVFGNQKPSFTLLKVAVQKNTTEEVIQELTELMQQLVDIVKSLQTSRPGSGLDNELGILGMVGSGGKGGARVKDSFQLKQYDTWDATGLMFLFTTKYG